MSYYTTLQVTVFDPETFEVGGIASQIKQHLDTYGISHDVLGDVSEAFRSGESLVKVHGGYVVSLMDCIHQHVPELEFCARGWGEDPDDIWIRNYSRSGPGLAAGPFDLSTPSASAPAAPSGLFTRTITKDGRGVLVRPLFTKVLVGLVLAAVVLVAFSYVGAHT